MGNDTENRDLMKWLTTDSVQHCGGWKCGGGDFTDIPHIFEWVDAYCKEFKVEHPLFHRKL